MRTLPGKMPENDKNTMNLSTKAGLLRCKSRPFEGRKAMFYAAKHGFWGCNQRPIALPEHVMCMEPAHNKLTDNHLAKHRFLSVFHR